MLDRRLQSSPIRKFYIYLLVLSTLYAGSHISLLAKHDYSVSDFYLPSSISLLLIYWIGPRYVLPMVYLNAVVTSYHWGTPLDQWPKWFLFAIPETIYTFASWVLFRNVFKGKFWLPDIRSTLLFLTFGVFIPAVIVSFFLQSLMLWNGNISSTELFPYVIGNILSEFTTTFFITLPALYYLTPKLIKSGVIKEEGFSTPYIFYLTKLQLLELAGVFAVLAALIFRFQFTTYWYLYGFVSLYVALRFGFGPVVITNFFILLISYVFPRFILTFENSMISDDVQTFFVASNFLFIFAVVTGRVISDLRLAKFELVKRNVELKHANEELDQFVYRVSHDLTAPLKSILGLVNIGKISKDEWTQFNCIQRIEESVVKLETFISQLVDYLRNNRQNLNCESFRLMDLCQEILENISVNLHPEAIHFDIQLEADNIYHDKTRLKIILHNLVHNAVKFQKRHTGHEPYVKIESCMKGEDLVISIEDNGEGIQPEHQANIFDMFYRANENSKGSGLGLYIAKETAKRINSDIWVKSEYGRGSVFTLKLKDINAKIN